MHCGELLDMDYALHVGCCGELGMTFLSLLFGEKCSATSAPAIGDTMLNYDISTCPGSAKARKNPFQMDVFLAAGNQ